jgi:hypothetical protein
MASADGADVQESEGLVALEKLEGRDLSYARLLAPRCAMRIENIEVKRGVRGEPQGPIRGLGLYL